MSARLVIRRSIFRGAGAVTTAEPAIPWLNLRNPRPRLRAARVARLPWRLAAAPREKPGRCDPRRRPGERPCFIAMTGARDRSLLRFPDASPARPASVAGAEADVESTSPPGDAAVGDPSTSTPAPRVSYSQEDAFGKDQRPSRWSAAATSRRGSPARWIVGVVAVGMLALAVTTVGRRMLPGSKSASMSGDSPGERRILSLLQDGEKSLQDGDLESAKEQFDKASALSERNTRVVADLAHLSTIKADTEWLHLRLLAPDDAAQSSVRRDLQEAVQRTRKAVAIATDVAPAIRLSYALVSTPCASRTISKVRVALLRSYRPQARSRRPH